MAKREFLQLAHIYAPAKHGIGGYYASEKLDGGRCFWDGGATRGLDKSAVPWANCAKDDRYKTKQVATGLWSRYGNVIHAPSWWLDSLPAIPLDGELYGPPRQELMSIIKDLDPGPGWMGVKYYAFDAAPIGVVLEPGVINTPNFFKIIPTTALAWYKIHSSNVIWIPDRTTGFESRFIRMEQIVTELAKTVVIPHKQTRLPMSTPEAECLVTDMLLKIVEKHGEGIIVRAPHAEYKCERVHTMLKIKDMNDAEGKVVGYVSGRMTDKGSKLLGMMGALVLDYEGKRLELSGFTDEERRLTDSAWAAKNPGKEVPDNIYALQFPRGTVVTFKYRGTSLDGIPQEARYWRRREEL